MVQVLKSSALMSRFRLGLNIQTPLPASQWQTEVENWHNGSLAILQGLRIDQATGPGDTEVLKYFWSKPGNKEERYLCKNQYGTLAMENIAVYVLFRVNQLNRPQKIISTAHTNFSTLSLVLTIVLGVLIILFEYKLESIIIWLEYHRIIKTSSLEWFSNDTLQLQRMAHEELGLGDWTHCVGARAVPVTEGGQILGFLNCEDPTHPRLVRLPRDSETGNSISASVTKLASHHAAEEWQEEKNQRAFEPSSAISQKDTSDNKISPSPAGTSVGDGDRSNSSTIKARNTLDCVIKAPVPTRTQAPPEAI
ncbi:MAG: hypothetical protein Q9160_007828 [Pyrenula sp. 1 TL-2023]